MIRNLMFGISLLTLTGASAIAAPAAMHGTKVRVVAQAADTAAPAGDKTAPKKEKKHTKKAKDASKPEGAKDVKVAPEKASEKAAK
jgi:hypothetical protein